MMSTGQVWDELMTLEKERKRDREFWVNLFKNRVDEEHGNYEDEDFGSYCYNRLVGFSFNLLYFIRTDKSGGLFMVGVGVGEPSEIIFNHIDNVLKMKQLELHNATKNLPF
jgi:hypothetical protein